MSDHADIKKPEYGVTLALVGAFIAPILLVMLVMKFELWNYFPVTVLHSALMSSIHSGNHPVQDLHWTPPLFGALIFVGICFIPALFGLGAAALLLKFKKRLGMLAPVLWVISVSTLLLVMCSFAGNN